MRHVSKWMVTAHWWLLVFLSSCAPVSSPPAIPLAESEANDPSPLFLTIEEEYRDENQLSIRGSLKAKERWDEDRVGVVRLQSLHGETILGEALYPVKGLSLSAETPHSFTISVSAGDISDYQLSFLWGEEAQRLLRESVSTTPEVLPPSDVRGPLLELSEIEVSPSPVECVKGKCDSGLVITGRIKNLGANPIRDVTLGVTLQLLTGESISEEETVPLLGLELESGESKPVELGISIPQGFAASDITGRVRVIPG